MRAERAGELPIQYLALAVWRYRAVVVSVIALALLAAVVKLQVGARAYTVTMGVTAVEQEGGGQQSSLSQGLALLGAAPASSSENLFDKYLDGLHSVETARVLMAQPQLMHRVFASNWSESTHSWVRPHGLGIYLKSGLKSALGFSVPTWTEPTPQVVADYLSDMVAFEKNKESPVVRITMVTGDRQLGLDLLYAVHNASDGVLRQRALTRASNYVDYLNKRLNEATAVEYRQAIAGAIVAQEKTRMRAASVLPFAADMFARPSASTLPTLPAAASTLVTAVILGLVLGIFAALLCNRYDFDPFGRFASRRSGGGPN